MIPTWHRGASLHGEPYPTRHPVPRRFRGGDIGARDLMDLTQEQELTATAAHELGHALLWLAGGLHVARASTVSDGRRNGHAEALPTGVAGEARLRAIGLVGGERAEDRWLREAGLWNPDRAALVEIAAHEDRAWLLQHTTPRPAFGTGGPDYTALHEMADEALDPVWPLLMTALPILVRQGVMSGEELAACTGLPLPPPMADPH
ncbi:hypothetical protein ACFV1L_21820 [Kitasatospora sp. NPDC059646]|uniref:hypothetical protein n=1 Tax=Kitasatospora sp. NPDC059646 TaxID=3346893 RepID=UPI0036B5F825